MNLDNDWKALSETWQSQAAPGINLDAVRTEVRQRGRSLRRKFWLEVVVVVLYAALCVYIVLVQDSDLFEKVLFTALGGFLIVYQGYMFWLRRRQLSDAGLDVESLVDLELRRSRTTISYWRVGMWTGTAMWGLLYIALMVGLAQDWPLRNVAGLAGGLLANVVLMPAMGLFGLWRCRQELSRMARFRDLQAQLRNP